MVNATNVMVGKVQDTMGTEKWEIQPHLAVGETAVPISLWPCCISFRF